MGTLRGYWQWSTNAFTSGEKGREILGYRCRLPCGQRPYGTRQAHLPCRWLGIRFVLTRSRPLDGGRASACKRKWRNIGLEEMDGKDIWGSPCTFKAPSTVVMGRGGGGGKGFNTTRIPLVWGKILEPKVKSTESSADQHDMAWNQDKGNNCMWWGRSHLRFWGVCVDRWSKSSETSKAQYSQCFPGQMRVLASFLCYLQPPSPSFSCNGGLLGYST